MWVMRTLRTLLCKYGRGTVVPRQAQMVSIQRLWRPGSVSRAESGPASKPTNMELQRWLPGSQGRDNTTCRREEGQVSSGA